MIGRSRKLQYSLKKRAKVTSMVKCENKNHRNVLPNWRTQMLLKEFLNSKLINITGDFFNIYCFYSKLWDCNLWYTVHAYPHRYFVEKRQQNWKQNKKSFSAFFPHDLLIFRLRHVKQNLNFYSEYIRKNHKLLLNF